MGNKSKLKKNLRYCKKKMKESLDRYVKELNADKINNSDNIGKTTWNLINSARKTSTKIVDKIKWKH